MCFPKKHDIQYIRTPMFPTKTSVKNDSTAMENTMKEERLNKNEMEAI